MKKQYKKYLLPLSALILLILSSIFLIIIYNNKNQESQPSETEQKISENTTENTTEEQKPEQPSEQENTTEPQKEEKPEPAEGPAPTRTGNCTVAWGPLTLINANFTVDDVYISVRKNQLIDIDAAYGIKEGNPYNGTPLLDSEAAVHLFEMSKAYTEENPGHALSTLSCFRAVGTSCGRLCAATGTSEHHAGYSCDLYDPAYGATLSTDDYPLHPEWQWLKANSYKFGFIDRYPAEWAGSSMSEPLNVNASGTTGYYETWHYRYVGPESAEEIATGKYNSGAYDSLEHYLSQKGYLRNLLDQTSCAY